MYWLSISNSVIIIFQEIKILTHCRCYNEKRLLIRRLLIQEKVQVFLLRNIDGCAIWDEILPKLEMKTEIQPASTKGSFSSKHVEFSHNKHVDDTVKHLHHKVFVLCDYRKNVNKDYFEL